MYDRPPVRRDNLTIKSNTFLLWVVPENMIELYTQN